MVCRDEALLLLSSPDMKLKVWMLVTALLAAFLPLSAHCRPIDAPASHRLLLPRPLLLHLGEEFSLRLGGGHAAPDLHFTSPSSLETSRALLKLEQHVLGGGRGEEDAEDKGKRSDEPPLSLDLTFHLLREVLEMARAEQMAQQADTNRRMMDMFGK